MLLDPLANAFSKIMNAERARKKETVINPVSKLIIQSLEILRREGYIRDFEMVKEEGKPAVKVFLAGRINSCGPIKPRYSVRSGEFEKWEKRFLPAAEMGLLILTTSKGVMTHKEARRQGIGGKLLAYVY
jgi:small subunit ribosomal protein S8